MIFGDWSDSHDKRVMEILEKGDRPTLEVINFNLVGVRRRLNNIEVGVWLIVLLLAVNLYRSW